MDSSDAEDIDFDSDGELQEAFRKGLLKPGLNVVEDKKEYKNDVPGMKRKLEEFRQNLNWIERLDLENKPAPLAPELAVQIEEQKRKRESLIKKDKKSIDVEDDKALNDFRRETGFYRQAQSAVLNGIPMLHKLGVTTKRPDDYFAQMAKSDDHMQKSKPGTELFLQGINLFEVREVLNKKKAEAERYEKIRQLRQQKAFGKKTQVENKLQKQKNKRELMEEVKKYRKGLRTDLDFLDDKRPKHPQKNIGSKGANRSQMKRKKKDTRYGFGGKKRGMKTNTRESAADVSGYKRPPTKGKPKPMRPGKSKRQKLKNKKR
ncbi:hypothetical protein J437_LFUL001918 [Ladona fulva]|uniref:Uncharacterized protein n=1 Tax=Ladona fulva TaxID=123851 RepID=A0A8K0NZ86_LADFU|nr:hypothetical protein J437_LFUL001918 [Ladona fulva]